MKKILLTGGSGFIGRNIKESFLSEKYVIISPSSKELNLADDRHVTEFFNNKFFDVVLHCAAKPAHRNAKDKTGIFETNTKMFQNLVKRKDNYKKFINFSSGAVYDQSKNISLVKETDFPDSQPSDDYGAYKYNEQKQVENLENFLNLNLFGVFGKYEDWEIRFISNAICKTLFDMPITLRQNRRFSYLFIDDLMPILEFFIENDTKYKSYNIVPSQTAELLEIADIVRDLSKSKKEILLSQEGFGLDYTADNARLLKEFENAQFTSLKSAIAKLYEYYKENKNMINPVLLKIDK